MKRASEDRRKSYRVCSPDTFDVAQRADVLARDTGSVITREVYAYLCLPRVTRDNRIFRDGAPETFRDKKSAFFSENRKIIHN